MKKLKEKNKGDQIVYTSCYCNCGCDHNCVFKAHVRDGVVVAVEPDDRYNTGVGREDEVLSEKDLLKVVKLSPDSKAHVKTIADRLGLNISVD